jgi:hypothetical protein
MNKDSQRGPDYFFNSSLFLIMEISAIFAALNPETVPGQIDESNEKHSFY